MPLPAGRLGLATASIDSTRKGTSGMRLSHILGRTSAVFDDPNLVSSAGLVPTLALADRAGLRELAEEHLSVPSDKGANAGLKVASLVAGMVAGGRTRFRTWRCCGTAGWPGCSPGSTRPRRWGR